MASSSLVAANPGDTSVSDHLPSLKQSKQRIMEMLQNRNVKQTIVFEQMQQKVSEAAKTSYDSVDQEIQRLENDHSRSIQSLHVMAKSLPKSPLLARTPLTSSPAKLHHQIGVEQQSPQQHQPDDTLSVTSSVGSEDRNEAVGDSLFKKRASARLSIDTGSPLNAYRRPKRKSVPAFSSFADGEASEKLTEAQQEIRYLNKLLEKQTKENKELRILMRRSTEKEHSMFGQLSRLETENRKSTVQSTRLAMKVEKLKQEIQKLQVEKPKFRYIYKTIQGSSPTAGQSNPMSPARNRFHESEEMRKLKMDVDVLKQRLKLATRPIIYEQERGPNGFVCMIFTDVESSCDLWEYSLEGMTNAILTHNNIIRKCIKVHHCYECKTEGDAFMVAAPSVLDAVSFVLDAQYQLLHAKWDERILLHEKAKEVKDPHGNLLCRGLRVRIGMECGYPMERLDETTQRSDYYGTMVNTAARISASARGGEILISKACHEEIKDMIGGNAFSHPMHVEDIGFIKLKGIKSEEYLRAIFVKGTENRPMAPRKGEVYTVPSTKDGSGKQQSIVSRLLYDRVTTESKKNKDGAPSSPVPGKDEGDPGYASIQNQFLKKELADKVEMIKQLEGEMAAMKHEMMEIQKINPGVAIMQRQRSGSIMRQEVDSLKKQIDAMATEQNVLRDTNQRLQSDLKAARDQVKDLQKMVGLA